MSNSKAVLTMVKGLLKILPIVVWATAGYLYGPFMTISGVSGALFMIVALTVFSILTVKGILDVLEGVAIAITGGGDIDAQ